MRQGPGHSWLHRCALIRPPRACFCTEEIQDGNCRPPFQRETCQIQTGTAKSTSGQTPESHSDIDVYFAPPNRKMNILVCRVVVRKGFACDNKGRPASPQIMRLS